MTAVVMLRVVCKQLGIDLPKLRRLVELDESFPPITWLGPRSGFVFREDLQAWIAARHERDAAEREQRRRGLSFVKGIKLESRSDGPPLPDFLRTKP